MAVPLPNVFEWAINAGLMEGDANAYKTGKFKDGKPLTAADYEHALRTMIAGLDSASDPTARAALYSRIHAMGGMSKESDYKHYSNQQATAEELENLINVASGTFAKQAATAAKKPGVPQVPVKPDPLEPGAPAAPKVGTASGVLKGGQTWRVKMPDNTYRWYQGYEFPPGSGNWVAYQYDNVAQVRASLGDGFKFNDHSPYFMEKKVLAEASAEEVIGMAGNWNTYTREVMLDSAQKAGIRDPSMVGRIAGDPEMQRIAAQAFVGDWTPAQILAEQRKTKIWTETLYPGIKAFYGRTTEPEKAWLNYSDNVAPALTSLGYAKDANGGYDSNIKKMLDAGVDAQVFLENVPVFQQAVQNSKFFDVYKQRAQVELGKDVTFGDWFSVIKGEAAPELMQVAEGATVAYQAQQSGFGLGESMLQRLISERDLSEQEARNVFSEVNQAAIALGDTGLARGGLTRDDILSAAAGIAPGSGMTADEVKLKVAKLAQENDLFDEEKLQFYVGFDAAGRPTRPGLASLSPEGA